ncbi:MAG: hypothetical protein R6U78_13425 [Bacteroidales bacterium]
MAFTVMKAARVDDATDYYVLICDCGGESNVKGYLMARRDKLVSSGYSMIIGLRDVYPNFSRQEVGKLLRGLNFRLPQKHAPTRIYLAIMEIEAWFLGEYRHLKKVSEKLTPEFIEKYLGFNPATGNMEEREHPALDMKAAYRLGGHDYIKKKDRLSTVVRALDLDYFTHGLAERMPSLGRFVAGLEQFFSS